MVTLSALEILDHTSLVTGAIVVTAASAEPLSRKAKFRLKSSA